MATPLQPESAIDSWRHWNAGLGSRPVVLGVLSGGRSNRSFLLGSDISRLVLRINGPGAFLPGADRSTEAGVWQAASEHGIAPSLVYADRQNRFLVSAYIENNLPASPTSDVAIINQALAVLKTCHQLQVSAPAIDYTTHIERYWQIIETGKRPPDPLLRQQRKPMQTLLETLLHSDTPTGLCHHDPVSENFVGSPERLYLIDWEYAATGLQIMDYAAFASEWQIDHATIQARTGLDPENLNMAKALYEYLCALWAAAT
jgi:thiamine kinase-like enzyme